MTPGRQPDREAVARSGAAMLHRGPDDNDLYVTDRVAPQLAAEERRVKAGEEQHRAYTK